MKKLLLLALTSIAVTQAIDTIGTIQTPLRFISAPKKYLFTVATAEDVMTIKEKLDIDIQVGEQLEIATICHPAIENNEGILIPSSLINGKKHGDVIRLTYGDKCILVKYQTPALTIYDKVSRNFTKIQNVMNKNNLETEIKSVKKWATKYVQALEVVVAETKAYHEVYAAAQAFGQAINGYASALEDSQLSPYVAAWTSKNYAWMMQKIHDTWRELEKIVYSY